MMPELKPGERLDDLQAGGFRLIQRPGTFCLGTDSVLLTHFCAPKRRERIADLGCGNGAISLLLAAHHADCCVDGVEIQMEMADMARRSVALNGVQDRVRIHCADLRGAPELLGLGGHSLIVCNPPYEAAGSGHIDHIIARGGHTDEPQSWQSGECLGGHGCFVEQDDVGSGSAAHDVGRLSAVVGSKVAKGFKWLPVEVAGINGEAVEKDYFGFHALDVF